MQQIHKLEFWADSFHEGNWACEELSKFFKLKKVAYEKGFIPIFLFEVNDKIAVEITVLGSYKNWSPLPEPIADLLAWGKPDLIAYNPESKKILFAVEETAAVPTGNQALQRCERIYGSLRVKIPFWYLLGEFGLHVDGGVRRDSIWPTVLGIKLSGIQRTPCMVLHYSDQEHPEDYAVGEGVNSLFKALAIQIEIFLGTKTKEDLSPVLLDQYTHMLHFVRSQGANVVNFIPGEDLLFDKETPQKLASLVTSEEPLDNTDLNFFNWGVAAELPKKIYENIKPGGSIKEDVLVNKIEELVDKKVAYTLSGNAGSRPQDEDRVSTWIQQQESLFNSSNTTNASFSINIDDFPRSNSGRLHLTTAKNVFYLVDSFSDVDGAIKSAFPRLKDFTLANDQNDMPCFIYISNSLKPGRIFGDPFTGQLSAFANVFTKNVAGDKTRIALAYYPHQSHTQLFDQQGNFKKNKGVILMKELLDLALFQGGVIVNMKTGEII